jgi:hypothetical protein
MFLRDSFEVVWWLDVGVKMKNVVFTIYTVI